MNKPNENDWALMKWLARYLVHAPEFVGEYVFAESADESVGVAVRTDSDWGSCRTARRPTRGDVLCV